MKPHFHGECMIWVLILSFLKSLAITFRIKFGNRIEGIGRNGTKIVISFCGLYVGSNYCVHWTIWPKE